MPAKKQTARQKFTKKVTKERLERAERAEALMWQRFGSLEPTKEQCEKQGKGHRAATVDKRGRLRKPSCVAQRGLKVGRKPSTVKIVVKQGTLAPWKASLPTEERRKALLVATERMQIGKNISAYDAAVSIARKLNTLFIYRKNNRNPKVVETCNKVLDDEGWLRDYFGMAQLDRERRSCPNPSAIDLNEAIEMEFQQRFAKKPTSKLSSTAKRKRSAKSSKSMMTWNEFRRANKGKGYSQAQLSQMYRQAK